MMAGFLIKMVYFSTSKNCSHDDHKRLAKESREVLNAIGKCNTLKGRLNFVKFETTKINDCWEFISSNKLHGYGDFHHEAPGAKNNIKATGGRAFKFADLFKEKLGISLDKVDEMDCLVYGANFLLKAVHREAFTYMDGQKEYVEIDHNDLYPYLLVNIGSGVSMIKVDGDASFSKSVELVFAVALFGVWESFLTNCQSFDELLKLSHQGNNRVIDMLVGDIHICWNGLLKDFHKLR